MTELQIVSIDEATLFAFLLGASRSAAWLFIAPPFGRVIPARVRAGFAFALALLMSNTYVGELPTSVVGLAAAVGYQAFIGAALGFIVAAFVSVFSIAGSIIDFTGGFTVSTAYDPMTQSSAGVMGRLYSLVAVVLIFATGGHIIILQGFLRTFEAAPLQGPSFAALGELVVDNIGWLFVAAIEVAFPVVASMFLVEIGLGLVARAAPQTNVLTIGFALKTGIAVLVVAASIPLLPAAVETVVTAAMEASR